MNLLAVPHYGKHFDDALATYLLTSFGGKKWGAAITEAYYEKKDPIFQKKHNEVIAQGVIPIGWGEGVYDDHPPREKGVRTCAAILVAAHLGLPATPGLKSLLEYALKADTEKVIRALEVPSIIKRVNYLFTPEKAKIFYSGLKDIFDLWIKCWNSTDLAADRHELDEIVTFLIAKKFGSGAFPKIRSARVVYSHDYSVEYTGDRLTVRIKRGMCAAWEIARGLKMQRSSFLSELLNYVRRFREYSPPDFSLGGILSLLKKTRRHDLGWVVLAMLDAYMTDSRLMFTATARQYAGSEFIFIKGPRQETLKVCISHSDDPRLQRFCRLRGNGCDVLVQKDSNGNVVIFSNESLRPLCRMLSLYEAAIAKERGEDRVPQWYPLPDGRGILNGSLTHADIPTRVTMEEIVRFLKMSLNEMFFMHPECSRGVCVDPDCFMAQFGLTQCLMADKN